jgi:hypothetical protein
VFFFHNRLLQLLEPVLFYTASVSTAFWLVYFLSKKDPVECTLLPIWKSLMNLEHAHQDTCGKTLFYMTYRFLFTQLSYRKICSLVYITPYVYIIVRISHEKVKFPTQTCEQTELSHKKVTQSVWQAVWCLCLC